MTDPSPVGIHKRPVEDRFLFIAHSLPGNRWMRVSDDISSERFIRCELWYTVEEPMIVKILDPVMRVSNAFVRRLRLIGPFRVDSRHVST